MRFYFAASSKENGASQRCKGEGEWKRALFLAADYAAGISIRRDRTARTLNEILTTVQRAVNACLGPQSSWFPASNVPPEKSFRFHRFAAANDINYAWEHSPRPRDALTRNFPPRIPMKIRRLPWKLIETFTLSRERRRRRSPRFESYYDSNTRTLYFFQFLRVSSPS